MPVTTQFFPERGLIIHEGSAKVEIQEILEAFERQFTHPEMQTELRVLWDWTHTDVRGVSSGKFRDLARNVVRTGKTRSESKLAVVAAGPLQVGLFNMYAAFEPEATLPLRVFTSRDEALAWLEVD